MPPKPRPEAVRTVHSFSRMELPAQDPSSPRKRASTLQESGIPAIPEARHIDESAELGGKKHVADVFENNDEDDTAEKETSNAGPELMLPSTFDELPIEIRSLSERFLDSLSAKIHPTPLNADNLSDLFQEFYERASSHIATHIASLASRIGREKPTKSQAANARSSIIGRPRAGSGAKKTTSSDDLAGQSGGEMLTPSEVADRRKARRLLELKRLALEEAVERGVCEKVYEKIWKHRSTDDDARDEKLRSRTAALALVGIGLKELHTDNDPEKADARKAVEEKEEEIHQSLAAARESLQQMDEERYPLGKLQHLTAAHKSIVETLSQLFPSSSSADEILPTLIYTLITSPPEGINVVSNLNFIQRFRSASKVDGEAAYCLVNLEAAISFLETVDLSSLRADELPQGPPKSHSGASTPMTEKSDPAQLPSIARTLTPDVTPITVGSTDHSTLPNDSTQPLPSPTATSALTRPSLQPRRISTLMQAQADRFEAGRENFLNAADKIYDSINGTLDNSLQFVFGRFKDQIGSGGSPLPKTLEDARKLVSQRSVDDADSLSVSGRSSPGADDPLSSTGKTDNRMLELISGRKQLRDPSVDSSRSGGSGNSNARRTVSSEAKSKDDPLPALPASNPAGNLFATINPLNRFGMPAFPRFGRPVGGGTPAQPSPTAADGNAKRWGVAEAGESASSPAGAGVQGEKALPTPSADGEDDLNAREALAELRRIKPPKKRFLEVRNAGELRIEEVEELLQEYRRLAKAIGEAIAN